MRRVLPVVALAALSPLAALAALAEESAPAEAAPAVVEAAVVAATVEAAKEAPPAVDVVAARAGRHLLNPTPREAMRELSTDRPDKTESPYTVDAGHFQFETDLVTAAIDRGTAELGFNVINLKVGLTSWSDLQLIVGSYRLAGLGGGSVTASAGDLTPRLKIALLGNDGGPFALGTILYGTFEAGKAAPSLLGASLPMAFELPNDWSAGAMLSYENRMGDGDHHLLSMATVGHELVPDLGFFVELYSDVALSGPSPLVATLDLGLTWQALPGVQFDAGAFVGLTDAADDINPFLGLTMRY